MKTNFKIRGKFQKISQNLLSLKNIFAEIQKRRENKNEKIKFREILKYKKAKN